MSLELRFQEFIREQRLFTANHKLLLAVSGGVDSVVLCDLCHRAGYDFAIAHCNFQLRGDDSNRDEQFVKKLAEKYKVVFFSKSFDTKAIAATQKKSVEETARDLRYEWFQHLLNPDSVSRTYDYIVTAHHADDNIETVLMKFFRGTGIKGMRGMLPKNGKVTRPLLFARRKELEDYALVQQLEFVTDYTNYEDTFARNFFRNRIIPEIRKFFPEAEQNILGNIQRFSETEELYNQAINQHKKMLEKKGNEVFIPALKLKKSAPLHSITYEIIKDFGFTARQTDEVIALLDSDSGKYVASSTHRIIRNRNWLIIAPLQTMAAQNILIESTDREILFEGGILSISCTDRLPPFAAMNEVMLDVSDIRFPLLLRKWKTGDYFYPLGMTKKKKLARFFIDQKLSKTQKEQVWVLESDKRILWVIGYRIDERFKITGKTKKALVLKLSGQIE